LRRLQAVLSQGYHLFQGKSVSDRRVLLSILNCREFLSGLKRVENFLKFFSCQFVVSVFEEHASVSQAVASGSLVISDGVAVSGDGLWCGIDFVVAMRHLEGYLASVSSFLGRSLRVGLLELVGGIEVFAQSQELLSLLQVLVGSTACEEHEASYQ